jgi:aspartyl-tRNA(Asn)/glutamyl-tRNA(Gln) amidotransferase subunit B
MRSKEEAADYRYFPEPDLVPFVIEPAVIQRVKAALPELPAQRRVRFQERYELSAYDAQVIAQDRALADLFEGALATYPKPKPVANWIMGDLSAYLNAHTVTLADVKLRPEWLGHLLQLIDTGTLSGKMAKDVFSQALERGVDPAQLVNEGGLRQIVDAGTLEQIAEDVLQAFPKSVEDYSKGKTNALMYLVGQAMKRSQGKANPEQMTEMLKRKLVGRP